MSASEPTVIKGHAKRHQNEKPPAVIITALGLKEDQASSLYVSDVQEYSSGARLVQLHYAADKPATDIQRFRGWVFKIDPMIPNIVSVRAKSFPYEDPIIADVFPEGFTNEKFSVSRQGFVARVFCPFNEVNISTHRKIDCARSRFGPSIPMKEMFEQAAALKGLDVQTLFNGRDSKLYCHVFFVSHEQLRLIPSEDDSSELIYLGSMKTQTLNWADQNDEDDQSKIVLEDMIPSDPKIAQLEALRPKYYDLPGAQELFNSGVPLVAWSATKAPTRLVPVSYDRKERLRGNTPNLKLAWYKLLQNGEQDALREVLPECKHHLLQEYWDELLQQIDGAPIMDEDGKVVRIQGPPLPKDGSLIKYLIEAFYKLKDEKDREAYFEKLGKASGPVTKTLESYSRPMTGLSPKEKTKKLAKFLRNHLWFDVTTERVYTLIAEFKKAMTPPAEKAESGEIVV